MALRFFRRMKLFPGVSLNMSKSGPSLSFGPRGAKVTLGKRGIRKTVGLPGTGLYYTEQDRWGASSGRRKTGGSVQQNLDLGFFERLKTPEDERAFIEGVKAFVQGNETGAMEHLKEADSIPDALFLNAFLEMKQGRFSQAAEYFTLVVENTYQIGSYFQKYGLTVTFSLPITEHVHAHIGPSLRGALLALIECEQECEQLTQALEHARYLYSLEEDDPAALLSLTELIINSTDDREQLKELVKMTTDIDNESELHAALLYYRGKALAALGMPTAARDSFTAGLRRKKNRSEALLRTLRYDRAFIYKELGEKSRFRGELEKIYAQDPDYADVAEQLTGTDGI